MNDNPETTIPPTVQPGDVEEVQATASSFEDHASTPSLLQAAEQSCLTCGGTFMSNGDQNQITGRSYVYALGRIEHRFPNLGLEKEYVQATGRAETAGLTDRQAVQKVLLERQNRYLARQLCWVLTVEELDTYILHPRDPMDFEMLIEALRARPSPEDVDIVIGLRGPIAPPERCNGLMVPIVVFDQIYSFERDTLVKSIPRPEKMEAELFESAAMDLFSRIMQMADNAGATDEHRALNYLAVRYPRIYERTTELFADNHSLTGVDVRPSRLSGTRKIVDVIFSYTQRQTDVTEKEFVRVDVTEMFPFLVTKLSPFYER
jgi:hypothetical protein